MPSLWLSVIEMQSPRMGQVQWFNCAMAEVYRQRRTTPQQVHEANILVCSRSAALIAEKSSLHQSYQLTAMRGYMCCQTDGALQLYITPISQYVV